MNNLVRVHIMTGTNELHHEEPRFGFGEATAATEHVHKRSRCTEFERHVDVVGVFETVGEPDDVGVLEGAVDFDFCIELEMRSALMMCRDVPRWEMGGGPTR